MKKDKVDVAPLSMISEEVSIKKHEASHFNINIASKL
jgi:hypothetical protein